jgi:LysR family hydrogen peroxide-inducible transcriptional activator
VELRQLRYLVAVADAGSFTAGAKRAFVSQPTLSQAIAALEDELGVVLFHRTARGAVPTSAGGEAVDIARSVLRGTAAVKNVGRVGRPAKLLRLGVLPTVPNPVLAATLATLAAHTPGITCRTEDASLSNLHRRLIAGRLDAILTNLALPATPETNSAELARDTMRLAFHSDQAPRQPVTPDVLHRAPLIVRVHCELLEPASRILDERQVRPIVVGRTDSDSRALALVAAGAGACLMPDSLTAPGVTHVEVSAVHLTRRIGLRWTDATAFAHTLNRLFQTRPSGQRDAGDDLNPP